MQQYYFDIRRKAYLIFNIPLNQSPRQMLLLLIEPSRRERQFANWFLWHYQSQSGAPFKRPNKKQQFLFPARAHPFWPPRQKNSFFLQILFKFCFLIFFNFFFFKFFFFNFYFLNVLKITLMLSMENVSIFLKKPVKMKEQHNRQTVNIKT